MTVEHYLYFPREEDAQAAMRDLAEFTLNAMVRRSGDEWLVLAASPVSDLQTFDALQLSLERVCEQRGGEYDGWEAATRNVE